MTPRQNIAVVSALREPQGVCVLPVNTWSSTGWYGRLAAFNAGCHAFSMHGSAADRNRSSPAGLYSIFGSGHESKSFAPTLVAKIGWSASLYTAFGPAWVGGVEVLV